MRSKAREKTELRIDKQKAKKGAAGRRGPRKLAFLPDLRS
jgi:hypothetical protein